MEELIDSIKKDFRSYISPNDPKFKKLSKLRGDLFNLSQTKELFDEGNKKSKDTKRKIEELSNEITKLETEIGEIKNNKIYENAFEWRFEFPEVLNGDGDYIGFDMVIGNPPYGVKEKGKRYLDFVEMYYPIARKAPDSYFLFMIRGNEILKKNCEISFIVPNTFCDIEQGDEFRNWFLTSNNLIKLYDSSWVFQDAVVDTVIYFQLKEKKNNETIVVVSNDFIEKEISIANVKNNRGYKIDYRAKQEHKNLLSKIELGSVPLVNLSIIKAGVKLYEKGKGNPKQTDEIVNKKNYTKVGEQPNGWRRLIRGGDISKYSLKHISEYVNYGEWLAAPRDISLFTGERILIRRTDDIIKATFVNDDSICVNSCHVLISRNKENIKFLLAILNSKLLQWVFEIKNPQMVDKAFAEIKVVYVESLPIKFPSSFIEIQSLVEEILKLKEADSTTDTTFLENKIDDLVYKMYDLTEDEIKIIEQNNE